MKILISIIAIFSLIFSCTPSKKESAIVQKVNSFYQENREKSFEDFKNWNISCREGEKDLYILDFIENKKTVKDRFIIKNNNDSLYMKRIYPNQDTIFHLLNKQNIFFSDYPFSDLYFSDLILRFFSFKASKIINIEDELFLIEKEEFSMIYSESKIEDLQNLDKYKDYIRFNEHVWYYVTE